MKVVIEPPKSGWIFIHLDQLTMRVSYILHDALRDLTDAVRAFEETGIAHSVDLVDEPGLHRLTWTAQAEGGVLTISELGRKPTDLREIARLAAPTRLELTLPFWRALRKLQTEFPPLPNRDWPYAFPEEALRLLSIAVARHKPR